MTAEAELAAAADDNGDDEGDADDDCCPLAHTAVHRSTVVYVTTYHQISLLHVLL